MDYTKIEQVKNMIADAVGRMDRAVTICELMDMCSPHIPVRGDQSICAPNSSDVVIYAGVSRAFEEAFIECVEERRIVLHTSTREAYASVGGQLALPLTSTEGMEGPTWAPVEVRGHQLSREDLDGICDYLF